jgi:hypothetical protein
MSAHYGRRTSPSSNNSKDADTARQEADDAQETQHDEGPFIKRPQAW